MEIVEVPLTCWTDAMSVENNTAANVCVLNVADNNQAVVIARIEQIEGRRLRYVMICFCSDRVACLVLHVWFSLLSQHTIGDLSFSGER